MIALHNVSPSQRRVNTGLKNTTTAASKSCKLVSSHCSSDSDSSHQDLPIKRFRFDANYCGLESTLRKMNVEQDGENSPEEMPASSFLTNFGSNRKRQSSLSFSPTKNNNNNNNTQSAANSNKNNASRNLKSSSNAYLQKQQQSYQNSQNSNSQMPQNSETPKNSKNPQNFQNPHNSQNPHDFNSQNFTLQNLTSQQETSQNSLHLLHTTPKSVNSSINLNDEAICCNSHLKKHFEKKFNYKRRLKHLPSQTQSKNLSKSPSSLSLKNNANRLHLADALSIFEEMLSEREEKLKEEFHMELQNKLAEQYEQFVRYNEDAVRAKFDNSCSYLS